ncbi:ABC transporter permease [Telmatospirillum sp.]|uniref:ABC transporter permease n=1 Tax=Telmatospirillum sp. TaxID=2079197 RepID=UPI0028518107|nr:ABC transporter permease [Telmatospirillum sp.]MDR3435640.1 ABC transporter permease [Telmatospirillum sp.]
MAAIESARALRARMFLRLLYRALTVRNGQVVVAVISIMVGAAVVSALASLYLDISAKMSQEMRTFGANFFIGPAPTAASRGIDLATYRQLVGDLPPEKLVGETPLLYGLVRLDLGNAVLVGVDFAGLRKIAPYWQVDGKWIGVDFDDRSCMVGRRLAETMELKPGSTVTVISEDRSRQTRLQVKAVIDTGDSEDEQMFVTLGLAQRLLDLPGRIDVATLSIVAQGGEADHIAARINEHFPGIVAKPIRKISESDGQILDKIEGLMALVAATILVITTLCVNATLTAMVARRAPEIGLQKALGAADRAIVGQFLSETAVICLVGAGLGLILGFGLAQILGQAVFSAWVTFRPAVLPLTTGLSLLAALAAAAVPIRRAVRIVPARVLKGE